MLVDDYLIFCKGTKRAAKKIRDVLEKYGKVYGQLINLEISNSILKGIKNGLTAK